MSDPHTTSTKEIVAEQKKEAQEAHAASSGLSKANIEETTEKAKESVMNSMDQAQATINQNWQQVKNWTNDAKKSTKEATNSAREAMLTAVSPITDVYKRAHSEEGTALRDFFATARENVNVYTYEAQVQYEDARKTVAENMTPVQSALSVAQTQALKANEFRQEHPGMAVAGLAAIVGAPSLILGGKMSAARNTVLVVGLATAVAYTNDLLAEKRKK